MASTFAAKRYPALAPVDATLVYIEAGQSNSNGFNSFDPNFWLRDYVFSSTSRIYSKLASDGFSQDWNNSADNGSFDLIDVGTAENNRSNTNLEGFKRNNPTMFFARSIDRDSRRNFDFRVIKLAQGSTGFEEGTGDWADGGDLDNAFENYYLKPALQDLLNEGRTIYLLPFFWVQGEQDSASASRAIAYEAQLSAFIARFRTWISIPNFPVIVADMDTGFSYVSELRQSRSNVASAANDVFLLDGSEWPKADNLHFLQIGYEQMAYEYEILARSIGAVLWGGFS